MKVNSIIAGIDTTHDLLPAYEVRLFAGKMLLELDNDDSCVEKRCDFDDQRDRCEAAINLFDQLLLENDENNELLFLTATAHYNLQAYSLGLDFATELEKVDELEGIDAQRLKQLLKKNPNVPELQAQMQEVQNLLNDIRAGMKEHPEAENEEGGEGMQIE